MQVFLVSSLMLLARGIVLTGELDDGSVTFDDSLKMAKKVSEQLGFEKEVGAIMSAASHEDTSVRLRDALAKHMTLGQEMSSMTSMLDSKYRQKFTNFAAEKMGLQDDLVMDNSFSQLNEIVQTGRSGYEQHSAHYGEIMNNFTRDLAGSRAFVPPEWTPAFLWGIIPEEWDCKAGMYLEVRHYLSSKDWKVKEWSIAYGIVDQNNWWDCFYLVCNEGIGILTDIPMHPTPYNAQGCEVPCVKKRFEQRKITWFTGPIIIVSAIKFAIGEQAVILNVLYKWKWWLRKCSPTAMGWSYGWTFFITNANGKKGHSEIYFFPNSWFGMGFISDIDRSMDKLLHPAINVPVRHAYDNFCDLQEDADTHPADPEYEKNRPLHKAWTGPKYKGESGK